ncbi:pectinesterase family protein [Sutcliffiella deserti]|uniref:pectinesterase family protein n=1 Tax=Sutcliffiella deserti TaxID=2875501 RepID=UPI001CBABDB4|nr:pectinesterase family protein [Sutcliffiella deserti]
MLFQSFTVSKDGTSDFTCIQDAIDHVRVHPLEPVTIFIKNGNYQEKLIIPDNKHNVKLVGESREGTIISFHESARMKDSTGKSLGTFRTPVVTALADCIQMESLTIHNTAGYGEDVGQALALYVAGDRSIFKNVSLLGNQDTLYTSRGRQLFQQCYIEGHVDFIFGAASTIFDQCEIHSLRKGYITAASTPEDQSFGYIFLDCRLTGAADIESVYLGRPWRPYAHTFFVRTWMGEHIKKDGWDNWRDEANEKTARYGEYDSYGPGALVERRVRWAKQLTRDEAESLTVEKLFPDLANWYFL